MKEHRRKGRKLSHLGPQAQQGQPHGDRMSMDAVYRRANELLSEPKMTADAVAELKELKRRVSEVASAKPPVAVAMSSSYVPYPWIDSPTFNEEIQRKREFFEHRTDSVPRGVDIGAMWKENCSAGDFRLTHSQLFLRNFMSPRTPYNGVLLFHGTGVGKSCSAVTIAEQFTDMRVWVVTRPGLADGFKSNIYDTHRVPLSADGRTLDFESITQCTGTSYSDRVRDRHTLTREQFDARIARLIRQKYTFIGPGQLSNLVDSMGDGDILVQRIRARFSNTVIIVDEAHHLRGEDNRKATPALRRILEYSEGVKLVLLTATPMFNRASDVDPLLNLLRANDKIRPPLRSRDLFDKRGSLTPDGEVRLLESVRGYVSYMRGENPFSFPVRLSPSLNGDPLLLRSSGLPVIDLKDIPISVDERIRDLELCGSPMGEVQRQVYREAERLISAFISSRKGAAAEDEDVNDLEGDAEGDAEGDKMDDDENGSTALHSGQHICNVVFPVTSGQAYGKAGFDNVFRRISGGKALQVQYKPGTLPFLSPDMISSYAPKIKTIVDRVMRSEGVVMIYSRWVWSGLVPIAIALEHAGMTRFDSTPLLVYDGKPAARTKWTYAVISGQRDVASDMTVALERLRSVENVEGAIVKVVLVSDKGSEGLDLRYVREVHVAEPWYHMNKIEQIVGRASRQCSHAGLPMAKRNVTVFLHVTVHGDSNGRKETVDLRAYRIAERKQDRISRVAAIMRDSSLDCSLNLARLFYDREALDLSIDLQTSQGVTVHGFRLGDPPGSQPKCRGEKPKDGVDDSTYDIEVHAYHMYTYRRLLRDLFAVRFKAKYSDAWEHVSSRFAGAKKELMSLALDNMVRDQHEILDATGRRGRVVYRNDAYLFQPIDETEFLADWERAPGAAIAGPRRMFVSDTVKTAESGAWNGDAFDIMLRGRVSELVLRLPEPCCKMADTVMDMVVDRLSHEELLRGCTSIMASDVLTDVERRALRSLEGAGVLNVRVHMVRSPFDPPGRVHCFDTEAHHLRLCQGSEGGGFQAYVKPTAEVVLAVMQPVPRTGTSVFKVVTPDARARGGCVCHQTSTFTSVDLVKLAGIAAPNATPFLSLGKTNQVLPDKKTLCEVYEVLLRKFRPKSIVRPVDAAAWREQST